MQTMEMIRRHLARLTDTGVARGYGPDDNRMWMASLDTRTGRYPADDTRPPHIPKRCYRWIESPRGCNLYWDMPQIAAAHAAATMLNAPALAEAADAYVRDFLKRCVAPTGLLLWGNHYYYDAFQGQTLSFAGKRPLAPVDMASETGHLHEARPLPPAWDALWRVSPVVVERAIREMLQRHLFDPASGGFNRHAVARPGCAFLEAGGILVDAAGWLFRKTGDRSLLETAGKIAGYGDRSLLETAGKIAGYSFAHRNEATGLLENNPTEIRWDKFTATTEVGLWAGCLLRHADLSPEWGTMAAEAVTAWLRHGYDERTRRYFGRLNLADGAPVMGERVTEYQPGEYADFWEPLFPAHDYPFQMAEACLRLHRRDGSAIMEQAVRRWARQLQESLPPRDGRGAYAEHYGRAIHLLCEAADALHVPEWRDTAQRLAEESVRLLWTGDLFRGHPGEDRYDAVDGVGCLMLGLMRWETGSDPEMMGFHF